ncbi:uncharacterized protein [Venturia canescens]|uniref:uncharacterized protein isoform X2 n=1 Tax=Venturia canescens TaxID=32260 RepID=UPI001C9BCCC1|nr:uncharacterized protein LOC122405699 isoform X2 [Venturia canescens]
MSNLFGLKFVIDVVASAFFGLIFAPLLLTSYAVVKWSKRCWLRFAKWRHPLYVFVESNSIQSILDHGRNQGVYTLLIEGKTIGDNVRSHLSHLVTTRPFMRMGLTTKFGFYAWKNLDDFSMDDHLISSPCYYRGRQISDTNIQDFVSDVTSKFLPSAQSPWQVHVINCLVSGQESQVCLVRAHHLLLDQEHLSLADFLPLKYSPGNWACQEIDSPFTNLYTEPSALPKLHQKLTESFSNYWNEFLCNNDPIEKPEILKKPPGLFQFLKIFVIAVVSTLKECGRFRNYRKSERFTVPEVWPIFKRESTKRNLSLTILIGAIIRVLNPFNMVYSMMEWACYIIVTFTLKTPILILRELRALRSSQKHQYPETLTSLLFFYLPLMMEASIEVLSITWIAIGAPRAIVDEIFLKHAQSNSLQTISPCGRKVVAWSDQIDGDILGKISNLTGATETEILLTAVVGSLKEYFKSSGVEMPENVLATANFVSQRALFVKNHTPRGMLCLALPTRTPLFEDDLVEILQVTKKNLQEARSRQSAIYAITAAESSRGLLTACLPSVFLKIALNHLSRRYSLSLTHVEGDMPVEGIDAVVYWSPPQGNCNMSMTLHRHASGARLGVMADAILGPEHSIITKCFPRSLKSLARTLGVPETPSGSPSPGPASPTTSPGY